MAKILVVDHRPAHNKGGLHFWEVGRTSADEPDPKTVFVKLRDLRNNW